MEKPKILLIDDEQMIYESIKLLLRREPYNILWAKNGKEGLDMFSKENPATTILDINMPIMNGIGFLKRAKSSDYNLSSVIVLTGHGEDKEMEQCFNLGVSIFFRKPFHPIELKGFINHFVGFKKVQKNLIHEINNNIKLKQKIKQMQGKKVGLACKYLSECRHIDFTQDFFYQHMEIYCREDDKFKKCPFYRSYQKQK